MKRFVTLVLALSLLVVPALLAKDAGNRDVFRVGEATFSSESEFTVPILISHDEDLAAMDIPLAYTSGVTLTSVSFENSAVADFDVKIANIDDQNHRVLIGLIKMVNAPLQNPYLKPSSTGSNLVATLNFKLDDPTMKSFTVEPYASTEPSHELQFVYNEYVDGVPNVRDLTPEFAGGQVSLNARTPGAALPTSFDLSQNVPNPFNPTTNISFALPTTSKVNLSVYNVLGQHVKTLVDADMAAGYQTVTWDGTDNTGHSVASGVYFYKLRAADFASTKKMLMLK